MKTIFDLSGKTILITGGSGHLGQALSEGLAAFSGHCIIGGRDEKKCIELAEKLNEAYHTDCRGLYIDISDTNSIQNAFDFCLKTYGRLDVLINNASYGAAGSIEAIGDEDFYKGIEGTLGGVFKMCKKALPLMINQKYGNIINIGSMYGVVVPHYKMYEDTRSAVNPANYGAGKAAVIHFTKYIAAHYGRYGIRANCISPGPFPNETVQEDDLFISRLKEKNPLGRIGRPGDLQGIIVLLASDAAGYITGQNICVDGGWTIW